MSFAPKVEIIPPNLGHEGIIPNGPDHPKKLQRNKWLALLLTFSVVLAVSLAWVWTQPEVFQSKAIIQVSYTQEVGLDALVLAQKQLTLKEQRLNSSDVLQQLSERLFESDGISLNYEALSDMLAAEANTESRTINLFATGHNKEVLQPVLSSWVDLYLSRFEADSKQNRVDDVADITQKMLALEAKIVEQRAAVQLFSEENNIVSLERNENRELNKIQGLSASLDEADKQEVSAAAELESVRVAISSGQVITHPSDQTRLEQMLEQVNILQSEMDALEDKFTPEYLALDPNIVRQQKDLEQAKIKLNDSTLNSQTRYFDELERNLLIARSNQKQFAQQLEVLNVKATEFNQKLDEYERQSLSLQQLENQSQSLKDLLIEKEVSKPFEARLNLLDSPAPSVLLGPNYWQQSYICLAAALGAGLLSLYVYSSIAGTRQPEKVFNSYKIVPPETVAFDQTKQQSLEMEEVQRVEARQAQLRLAQQLETETSKFLSQQELQQLYEVANSQTRLVVGLLLHGVSSSEISSLRIEQLDPQTNLLNISERRKVTLAPKLMLISLELQEHSSGDNIWPEPLSEEDINHLLVNAAHDANVPSPEQVSAAALRHTYLTFLVSTGIKLNELGSFVGYISPRQLSMYRDVKRQSDISSAEGFEHIYPLNW